MHTEKQRPYRSLLCPLSMPGPFAFPEYLLTGIAAGGYVVEGAGVFYPEGTGHEGRIAKNKWGCKKIKDKRPDPICSFHMFF